MRMLIDTIGILFFFHSLGAGITTAQQSWEPTNGPYGGPVNTILARPSDGVLFVGTYPSYVWRSTDNGSFWVQVKSGMTNTGTFSLAVDSSGTVFAGGYGGIFKSTNNGDTWSATGMPGKLTSGITIDPAGDVFAAAVDGIYRSTDLGTTFSQVGLAGMKVLTIVCNGNGYLFAGTDLNGHYRSTDHGATWTQLNIGLSTLHVPSILVLPASGDLLLCAGRVYRSTDTGSTWIQTSPEIYPTAVGVQPATGYLFACTDAGVYRSTDAGSNWALVTAGMKVVQTGSMTVNQEGGLFIAGDGGVHVSLDGGTTWNPMNRGLMNTRITSLTRDNSDVLYAGTEWSGFYRSTDLGMSWSHHAHPSIDPYVRSVAVLNPGSSTPTLFMGTTKGMYTSTNRGDSWSAVTNGLPVDAHYLALFVPPSGWIYAGAYQQGMYRSTDDGTTWTRLTSGLDDSTFTAFAVNPQSATIMAGSATQGIFFTLDQGDTWLKRNNGIRDELFVHSLSYVSIDAIWFAGTGLDSLYQSTDNGENWVDISHGSIASSVSSIYPKPGGEVFAAMHGNGLFRTSDGGQSWASFQSGMNNWDVRAILRGNAAPFLFAGTWGGGVYRTTHHVPVDLLAFDAGCFGGRISLHWAVEGERNVFMYEVERSDLPAKLWERRGSVHSRGDGLGPVDYAWIDEDPIPRYRTYHYRLRIVDHDGSYRYSPVVEVSGETVAPPGRLYQNFPNPVSIGTAVDATTSVRFILHETRFISLRLFDALGREVASLAEGVYSKGSHEIRVSVHDLVPGMYIYRLDGTGKMLTRNMQVVR